MRIPADPIRIGFLAFGLALIAGGAVAQPSITLIDSIAINGLSADGSVACGNSVDGLYEACRWTALEGVVRLGRSSAAAIGRGGGVPGISDDGNAISSSIISSDTLVTQGLWTKGLGWQETMPPVLPDGGNIDEAYGSAWGLSGDGLTVVGLYWRPGGGNGNGGSAHASSWTAAGGMVDLGSQGSDSRANGVNQDGSVVVGWSSTMFGNWQATVWDDGVLTVLNDNEYWCEAWGTNAAGSILVGSTLDTLSYTWPMVTTAMWKRTPGGWDEFSLGVLPGTFPRGTGQGVGLDVNQDGSIVVGYNMFSQGNVTGFVWTESQGMMKADAFLAGIGVTLPADFTVASVTCISADGRTIGGFGVHPTDFRVPIRGFVASLDGVAAVAEPPARPAAAVTGNHPNPFNPTTTIELAIAADSTVRVEIYDARGRLVDVVHDGRLEAGNHAVTWDGRHSDGSAAPSGVYFARVRGGNAAAAAHPMVLMK